MSGRRRRGGHEEEHVNHERWLVTYADTITLLMVLFIVLFAISQVDKKKFAELADGMAAGFGQPVAFTDGATSVLPQAAATRLAVDSAPVLSVEAVPRIAEEVAHGPGAPGSAGQLAAAADAAAARDAHDLDRAESLVRAALQKAGMAAKVVLTRDERGLTISVIVDDLVFPADSASLQPAGRQLLAVVAPALVSSGHPVAVEGHTNTVAVHPHNYPSEWELSSARASSVVRYLVSPLGMDPRRLTVVGYADTRPLVPASDPRGITLDRRVDIVVQSTLTAEQRGVVAIQQSVDPSTGAPSHA